MVGLYLPGTTVRRLRSEQRRAQGDRAREVLRADALDVIEIGNGARDPADRLHRTRGEAARPDDALEQRAQRCVEGHAGVQFVGVEALAPGP
jgi:hypothetical protein